MVLGTKSALDKQQIQTLSFISKTAKSFKKIIYENFPVYKGAMCAITQGSQKKCEERVGFFLFHSIHKE